MQAIQQIEAAGLSEFDRFQLRKRALEDTYFMASVVIGYPDLVEPFHRELCDFLDRRDWIRRALFAPRGHLKSCLIRAWEIQQVCRDPNVRILHVMSTAQLAEKAGRDIDQIFRSNTMLRYLFPEIIPDFSSKDLHWNIQQKTVPRTRVAGDPTFWFVGTGTKITGTHFEIIILDDFIEEEAARSEVVMEASCDWQRNCEPLLESPGKHQMVVIGTRWSLNDWYGRMMGKSKQRTRERIFRAQGDARYMVMKRAIIEDGKPVWDDRFSMETIAALKRGLERDGKGSFFYCQYMNDPVDEENCLFPRSAIRNYVWNEKGDKLILKQPNGEDPVVIPFKSLTLTMTVDPATTTNARSDRSAICVIGSHPNGYRINVYSWAGKVTPDVLVKKIFGIVKGFRDMGNPVEWVAIENISAQVNLNYWIKDLQKPMGISIPLYTKLKTQNRTLHDRIRDMVPIVNSGMYYTHDQAIEANEEMETYPNSGHPDWLAAFAYQPQVWPRFEMMHKSTLELSGDGLDFEEDDEPAVEFHLDRLSTGYGG